MSINNIKKEFPIFNNKNIIMGIKRTKNKYKFVAKIKKVATTIAAFEPEKSKPNESKT